MGWHSRASRSMEAESSSQSLSFGLASSFGRFAQTAPVSSGSTEAVKVAASPSKISKVARCSVYGQLQNMKIFVKNL